MNDPHQIARFSAAVAMNMPMSMMIMGLPRVCPNDMAPVIARTVSRVGVEDRKRFVERIELHYSKMAIRPRMLQAPRKFV